jgi:Poxvirus D5 protein-like
MDMPAIRTPQPQPHDSYLDNRIESLANRLAAFTDNDIGAAWETVAASIERKGLMSTEAAIIEMEAAHRRGDLRKPASKMLKGLASAITEKRAIRVVTKARWIENLQALDPDIAEFVDAQLDPKSGRTVPVQAVYDAYARWCEVAGAKPTPQTRFHRRLIAVGLTSIKINNVRHYHGCLCDEL